MVKKTLSVFNYLIFLLLGVLFLWLVFRNEDLPKIIESIRNADYFWILLGVLAGIVSHIARAARWNILINSMGYRPRLFTTFMAVMTGYLANTAVPRLGEVTRCGVLSKKEKIPFTELLGTVIAERIFDMIVMFIIIFTVILLQFGRIGGFLNEYIFSKLSQEFENNTILILIFVGSFILLLVLLYLLWRLIKPRIKNHRFYLKIQQFGKGLVEGIKTIKRTRNKGAFLFYTVMIWGLYTMMIYLPFHALEATSHLNLEDALTVMSIGSLGIVAPIPGGFGTYHGIVETVLVRLYGLDSNPAVSFATITHAAQTIMIIVIGGLSFFMLFLQKNKTKHELS